MTFIYFILLLTVIIMVHEGGHFMAAKLFGVYVKEFSLGMGPALFQRQKGETTYSIRCLPIGGYCAMAGEPDEKVEEEPEEEIPFERTIKGVAKWKQVIILYAGIFMNFVLAVVIFAGVLLYNGYYAVYPEPVLGEIITNSAAYDAGLQTGDRIVKITYSDGTEIEPEDFYDIIAYTSAYTDEAIYTIERDGETFDVSLTPRYSEEDDSYLIGLYIPELSYIQITPLNCLYYGALYCVDTAKDMIATILRLFRGIGLNNLSGPIGIYQTTAQEVSYGFKYYLMLIGLMSLNIGIFNAIPLPALDGGRVLLLCIEVVIGKPLNKKFETGAILASFFLFILLMIFVTYKDILRLFS